MAAHRSLISVSPFQHSIPGAHLVALNNARKPSTARVSRVTHLFGGQYIVMKPIADHIAFSNRSGEAFAGQPYSPCVVLYSCIRDATGFRLAEIAECWHHDGRSSGWMASCTRLHTRFALCARVHAIDIAQGLTTIREHARHPQIAGY